MPGFDPRKRSLASPPFQGWVRDLFVMSRRWMLRPGPVAISAVSCAMDVAGGPRAAVIPRLIPVSTDPGVASAGYLSSGPPKTGTSHSRDPPRSAHGLRLAARPTRPGAPAVPDFSRRWCRQCQDIRPHWRQGAPVPRHPAFVLILVAMVVALVRLFIEPWMCWECSGPTLTWSRGSPPLPCPQPSVEHELEISNLVRPILLLGGAFSSPTLACPGPTPRPCSTD